MIPQLYMVQSKGLKIRFVRYDCIVCGHRRIAEIPSKTYNIIANNFNNSHILLYCENCTWPQTIQSNSGWTIKLKIKTIPLAIYKGLRTMMKKTDEYQARQKKILENLEKKSEQFKVLVLQMKGLTDQMHEMEKRIRRIRI